MAPILLLLSLFGGSLAAANPKDNGQKNLATWTIPIWNFVEYSPDNRYKVGTLLSADRTATTMVLHCTGETTEACYPATYVNGPKTLAISSTIEAAPDESGGPSKTVEYTTSVRITDPCQITYSVARLTAKGSEGQTEIFATSETPGPEALGTMSVTVSGPSGALPTKSRAMPTATDGEGSSFCPSEAAPTQLTGAFAAFAVAVGIAALVL